jgi:hypothetical protein
MMTSHERIEHQIRQLEENQEELRILIKQYLKMTQKQLRKMRVYKWQQICLESYKK